MTMLTINVDGMGPIEFELLYGQKIDSSVFYPGMATAGLVAKVPETDILWNLAVLGNHIGIGQMSKGLLESIESTQDGDELTWEGGMASGIKVYKDSVAEVLKSINMNDPIIGSFTGMDSMILMAQVAKPAIA